MFLVNFNNKIQKCITLDKNYIRSSHVERVFDILLIHQKYGIKILFCEIDRPVLKTVIYAEALDTR